MERMVWSNAQKTPEDAKLNVLQNGYIRFLFFQFYAEIHNSDFGKMCINPKIRSYKNRLCPDADNDQQGCQICKRRLYFYVRNGLEVGNIDGVTF